MVCACDKIKRALESSHSGNSAGEKMTRKTEEEMDRQH